ncbi:MAG: hypothetical protein U0167_01505 [bacterium]
MSPARATLRGVGLVAAAAILFVTIRDAASEVRTLPLRFDPGAMGLSVGLLVVTYLGLAAIWARLLRDLGVPVRFGAALQTWSFSNLGRYIPGKVWQIAGSAVVARDLGLPAGLSVVTTLLSLAAMIGTGAGLGLLLAADALPRAAPRPALAVVALAVAILVLRPDFVRGTLVRLPKALGVSSVPPLRRTAMARLVGAHVLAWVGQGVSLAVLATTLGPIPAKEFLRFVGAYAFAHIAGLLALFAPGGLGVREAVLAWLLGPSTLGGAHLLAVTSRFAAVVAEILVVGIALAYRRRNPGGTA